MVGPETEAVQNAPVTDLTVRIVGIVQMMIAVSVQKLEGRDGVAEEYETFAAKMTANSWEV